MRGSGVERIFRELSFEPLITLYLKITPVRGLFGFSSGIPHLNVFHFSPQPPILFFESSVSSLEQINHYHWSEPELCVSG